MNVFSKIAFFLLYSLIGVTVFLFVMDFGKIFLAHSSNNYVAMNTTSYVNTFSVDAEKLLEADYGEEYVDLADVQDNLAYFLKTHYKNAGFKVEHDHVAGSEGNTFKMVFSPDVDSHNKTLWAGDVFARAKFYGFEGTPDIPGEAGSKQGLIRINIEQKIPAGMRNFMVNNGIPLRSVENPSTGEDYEGFIGYYSVESETAFTINIVK